MFSTSSNDEGGGGGGGGIAIRNASRPTIFLDLDNTLICSLRVRSAESDTAKTVNGLVPTIVFADYEVYKRPHLDEFLTYLFDNFRVAVWTAASRDYAAVITSEFILRNHPDRELELFLSGEDTRIASEELGGVKNLNALWDLWDVSSVMDRGDALIIDDLPDVFTTQPDKCIPIVAYYAQDPRAVKDDALQQVMDDLDSRYT
ncbi:22.4 kDa CTD phosphatase [Spodoptera frugiperda ascovirus 1a]|uniref:22.4 kDa CTD phosphatase n=1 Tax=Spodoptera frugiperda ascovirus 1a TaxID=113370 RepID=Q0E4Z2_SFAVA|nr:22.4 kDa CTD phosphatase [Spodoptera frugiperda ascovirus 1a]CAL44709.1 22.4 kDa CTD phosphatase [Spodoptera frugiperda ascovirus 1a]